MGLTVYMMFKFRASKYPEGEFPEQLHGHTKAEIGWTIVPALILVGVAVFSVAGYQKLNGLRQRGCHRRRRRRPPVVVGVPLLLRGVQPRHRLRPRDRPEHRRGNFEGKTAKSPDIITATQLVMPDRTEIDLTITSRDVIHSFWIPTLNGKRDAVPGRMSPWKIEADDPGVYFGQCTEFCGLSHSRMRMQVVAMTARGLPEWVDTVEQASEGADRRESQAWLDQQRDRRTWRRSPTDEVDPGRRHATAAERGLVTLPPAVLALPRGHRRQRRHLHRRRAGLGRGARTSPSSPTAPPSPAASSTSTTPTARRTGRSSKRGCATRPSEKAMAPDLEDPR